MNTLKVTEVLNADSMSIPQLEQVLTINNILEDYGILYLLNCKDYYSMLVGNTLTVTSINNCLFTTLKVESLK
jgi:inner membrane protein involved in colicin E2 resistance